MIRLVAAFVMVSGLAVAAPIPKSLKTPKSESLAGTVWFSASSSINSMSEHRFLDEGLLQYKMTPDEKTSSPGTWKQDGLEVTFEINNYSTHSGTVEGDTMKLKSVNKGNLNWETVLHRTAVSK